MLYLCMCVCSYSYPAGNAPVMANRLAREGCSVLLGAKMSGEAAKQLHNSVRLAGNLTTDHRNDVHLIMEYDKGNSGVGVNPHMLTDSSFTVTILI